jgi:hypothetical protein
MKVRPTQSVAWLRQTCRWKLACFSAYDRTLRNVCYQGIPAPLTNGGNWPIRVLCRVDPNVGNGAQSGSSSSVRVVVENDRRSYAQTYAVRSLATPVSLLGYSRSSAKPVAGKCLALCRYRAVPVPWPNDRHAEANSIGPDLNPHTEPWALSGSCTATSAWK